MDHAATLPGMFERINAHDVDGFCEYLADHFVNLFCLNQNVAPSVLPSAAS